MDLMSGTIATRYAECTVNVMRGAEGFLQYWLWCVWLGDISGGLFGAALYDILIFEGEESPMNWRWHWRDLHPNVLKAKYARWRKKIRVRNETRKESWLQRHHARKERKKTAQNSQKKEEV